jgi:hypothetical protein
MPLPISCGEADFEPRQPVGIGAQGESTIMFQQDFTDKNQSDTLSMRFGGEKRSKELCLRLLVYPLACIRNLKADRGGGSTYINIAVRADALRRVLHDVHQDLLEKNRIQTYVQRLLT